MNYEYGTEISQVQLRDYLNKYRIDVLQGIRTLVPALLDQTTQPPRNSGNQYFFNRVNAFVFDKNALLDLINAPENSSATHLVVHYAAKFAPFTHPNHPNQRAVIDDPTIAISIGIATTNPSGDRISFRLTSTSKSGVEQPGGTTIPEVQPFQSHDSNEPMSFDIVFTQTETE